MNTRIKKTFYKLGAVSISIVFATLLAASPALGSSAGKNLQSQPAPPDGCGTQQVIDNGKSIDAFCRDRGYTFFVRCTEKRDFWHRVDLISKDKKGRYAARFRCPDGPGNTVMVHGAYTTAYYFERMS